MSRKDELYHVYSEYLHETASVSDLFATDLRFPEMNGVSRYLLEFWKVRILDYIVGSTRPTNQLEETIRIQEFDGFCVM